MSWCADCIRPLQSSLCLISYSFPTFWRRATLGWHLRSHPKQPIPPLTWSLALIIVPAELELTRPNIFTKLPDFTTKLTEYDIATRSRPIENWLPMASSLLSLFFFFHIRVQLSQREHHFITLGKTAVILFIPWRDNLQQGGYSSHIWMTWVSVMNGSCLYITFTPNKYFQASGFYHP